MTQPLVSSLKVAYFDNLAARWDGWEDLAALSGRLAAGLAELGVGPHETVLDVGCGTGNLTAALLAHLSPAGRVVAIDLSPAMIAVAQRKIDDPRVRWQVGDASRLSLSDASLDRVLCCSVWPHFAAPRAVGAELARVLRPGGQLHVWHLSSRARVNEIHAGAGEAVRADVLVPGAELAALLRPIGFAVTTVVDDDQRFLVTARWPGRSGLR